MERGGGGCQSGFIGARFPPRPFPPIYFLRSGPVRENLAYQ